MLPYCMFIVQPCVPVPVKMEGPAQLPTLAPVMWGGRECSVKQVHIYIHLDYSRTLIWSRMYGCNRSHCYGNRCLFNDSGFSLKPHAAVHLCHGLSLYIRDLNC